MEKLFEALFKNKKIVEGYDFIKDISKERALAYIYEKIKMVQKNDDEDSLNNSVIKQMDEHLLKLGVQPLERTYIRELGLKLLDRTEIKNVQYLLDIAGYLTGMMGLGDNVAINRELVAEICISIADKKIELKYLIPFTEMLNDTAYRNNKIKWLGGILEQGAGIDHAVANLYNVLREEVNAGESSVTKSPLENIGLNNGSSLCYLNSVMQIISQIDGFESSIDEALRANKYTVNMQNKKNIHEKLSDFFKGMKGEKSSFDPRTDGSHKLRSFLKENGDAPYDDGFRQQDAQEAYLDIFNRVTEGDTTFTKDFLIKIEYIDILTDAARKALEKVLGKQREQQLMPGETLALSMNRTETTSILSLDIEDSDLTDLKTCFDRFLKEEDVEINYWPTSTKGKEINVAKLFGYGLPAKRIKRIVKMPKVLAIHFIRFRNQGAQLTKLDNNISFPLEFDANRYSNAENMPVYNLRGTIFHAGPSVHVGHYWALVENLRTKKYSLYNDIIKEPLSHDEMAAIGNFGRNKQSCMGTAMEGTAYMLFYEIK